MFKETPRFVRKLERGITEWEIKGNERIIIRFLCREHQKDVEEIFRREYPHFQPYENDVEDHYRQRSGIGRIACSGGHIVGGVLYDVYPKEKKMTVIRDIAVLRAWQRNGVATALLESIIRFRQTLVPDLNMFAGAHRDNVEMRAFLSANDFEPCSSEIPECKSDHQTIVQRFSLKNTGTIH